MRSYVLARLSVVRVCVCVCVCSMYVLMCVGLCMYVFFYL